MPKCELQKHELQKIPLKLDRDTGHGQDVSVREHSTGENSAPEIPAGGAPAAEGRSFARLLLTWFSLHKRDLPWRHTTDPYRIWVSEVMLQQTQVKTVIPYYQEFLQHFPALEGLAQADLDSVLAIWRGLGYYSRARHLWEGARHVLSAFGGTIPPDYAALRQIPGVGEYTAGAIASIAFGQKVPALDGNVRRVLARLLAWPEPAAKASSLHRFREQLRLWQPADHPGDFNQALMELGATLCAPSTPHCPDCPVSACCRAFASGNLNYPVQVPKKKPETMLRLTFVLLRKGAVYLQKRPANGLLADLWEFPGLELPESGLSSGSATFDSTCPNSRAKPARPVCSSRSAGPFDSLDPAEPSAAPLFAPAEWLAFYREAVAERSFDAEAGRFFQGSFPLYGPARHTFSHLRWKIYWAIIDLSCVSQGGPVLPEQEACVQPVRETASFLSSLLSEGTPASPLQDTPVLLRESTFTRPPLGPCEQHRRIEKGEALQTSCRQFRPVPDVPPENSGSRPSSWVSPGSLADYPLPSAFNAILSHLNHSTE